jgi:hypothetical protein
VVRAGDTESIVNLTGHMIHIYDGGRKLMTLSAEGREFRLAMREFADFSGGGVPITTFTYDIPELPPVEPGTWYVVSQVAAMAMVVAGVHRPDFLTTGPKVTHLGKIVGCRGLRQLVAAEEVSR